MGGVYPPEMLLRLGGARYFPGVAPEGAVGTGKVPFEWHLPARGLCGNLWPSPRGRVKTHDYHTSTPYPGRGMSA
jgi:hypothetical protein